MRFFGRSKREAAERAAAAALPLKEALIAKHTYPWTEAEREAMSRPPYPRPPAVEEHERTIEAALATVSIPPEDTGPLVATSAIGSVERLGNMDWQTPAQLNETVLIAVGTLSLAEADEIANAVEGAGTGSDVMALEVRRQIGLCHLEAEDTAAALAVAPAMGEHAATAFRDVGAHHARRGDTKAFFGLWGQYAAGTERTEMAQLKQELVEGVATVHGWQRALDVCREKRIGPKFHYFALLPLADAGRVDELLEILDDSSPEVDAVDEVDEVTQLQALVRAIEVDSPESPEADHPRLAGVLDRVIALDPTADKQTMRARDSMLLDLWSTIGDQATLERARKSIRTPWIKSEFGKALVRDVRRTL